MFQEQLVDQKMPVPYKQLEDLFQRVHLVALQYIQNNAVLDTKHSVEKDVQSFMEMLWVKRKSENEQHIIKYCEASLDALQLKITLIDGIQAQSYEVVGGHKKFKHDLERVGQQYTLELKDKGYADREAAIIWSTFMQTLGEAEMKIIQLDESLTEEEKKREKEENKQEMQRMVHTIEEQNKQLLEEQRESYEAQQKEIENKRDEQDREHQEKMTQLLQKLAELETDVNESLFLKQRILLLEDEDKERRREEQLREEEQRRRDENERKRDEDMREWRKDEKQRFERTQKDTRDMMQSIQLKSDEKDEELRRLKEDKERKKKRKEKSGIFWKSYAWIWG
ncbi:golgin subfamily A member 6-like protein 22 [Mya arenaria]|uniref:golgin subfamily A member 6-like protein 22 n=1 Tax=Mya arenaria TaxID=6604 RepID=UPI0022E185EB|nr:golgin subfamily A member 6-like protein 22 [Mya arenaria]